MGLCCLSRKKTLEIWNLSCWIGEYQPETKTASYTLRVNPQKLYSNTEQSVLSVGCSPIFPPVQWTGMIECKIMCWYQHIHNSLPGSIGSHKAWNFFKLLLWFLTVDKLPTTNHCIINHSIAVRPMYIPWIEPQLWWRALGPVPSQHPLVDQH